MKNLGKANAVVRILPSLPYIDKEAFRFNFEVSAFNWNTLNNSPYFKPLLTDQVQDELDTFAACFPSKRKDYMDNYIVNSDGSVSNEGQTDPFIKFFAVDTVEGRVADLLESFDDYDLEQPGEYTDDPAYLGPKWAPLVKSDLSKQNDALLASQWYETLGINAPPLPNTPTTATITIPKVNYLEQTKVGDGLWWALESEPFLSDNMPFYVTLQVKNSPPSRDYDTFFVISTGLTDSEQAYDIYLSYNNKPLIIEYPKGRASSSGGEVPFKSQQFGPDLSKFLDSQEEINIGVMTIAGRLVVFVNDIPLVYTRILSQDGEENSDNPGSLQEAKIARGAIRITGTNVNCAVNVCPMTFAPLAALALPIPTVSQENGGERNISFKGVSYNGTIGGPVCKLPTPPNMGRQLYGVDADQFRGDGGSASPKGIGFHSLGTVTFQKATSVGATGDNGSSDFYILAMQCETTRMGNTDTSPVANGGCPYFFRLKGAYQRPAEPGAVGGTLVPEVISASYTASAPDYFHSVATASITIYNKGGTYDYLKTRQYGIQLSFGWDSSRAPIFTGMIISASTSEEPGKETITLQCEDYMTVLKNTPIVNSPFYDGMVGYYAIRDLAKRAGITQFIKNWNSESEYFLPSGYAFSKPAMRFDSKQMLFECIIQIVKRFEAFVYFDPYGAMHVSKLPGGLFSQPTGFVGDFYRNPFAAYDSVILNEKTAEYNFASTANRISAFTLDRDTRNPILYTQSAMGTQDSLIYRRVLLYDSPSLGDLESCRTYISRLARRVFKPIRKTSFVTVGAGNAGIIKPLDFVKVDGDEYRIMSVGMKYDANNNDFTSQYGCEWLGG